MGPMRRVLYGTLRGLLLLAATAASASAEISMKVLVVNPSKTEVKAFDIRSALPPEVKPEHVLDADGLNVEYDSRTGLYLLVGSVTLKPKESVTRHVVLEDVWVIPRQRFTQLRQDMTEISGKLAGSSYEDQGRLLVSTVERRLAEIQASQAQPFLNPQQHISRYREDLKALQLVEADLVSLRQLMVMAALEPASQSALAGTALGGSVSERGTLSIWTTWGVIFAILALLGFVSLSFFLVWHRQLQLQLAKQAAHEAASGSGLVTTGNGHGANPPVPVEERLKPRLPLSP